MSFARSSARWSLSPYSGNVHSMWLAAVVALTVIGFSATGARAALIPGVGTDFLYSCSGISVNNVFEHYLVNGATSVGDETWGNVTTAYSFRWGSEDSTITGSGVMTFSGAGGCTNSEYDLRISFSLPTDTDVRISGTFSAPPWTYYYDSSGYHEFYNINQVVSVYRVSNGQYYFDDSAGTGNDVFDQTMLLPAGDYGVHLGSGAAYVGSAGDSYVMSFQFMIAEVPEPSSILLLTVAAVLITGRRMQKTTCRRRSVNPGN
jgi:hypothetical protein